MTRTELLAVPVFVALFAVSCGGKNGSGAGDNTPPTAVADLQVIHTTRTIVTLVWTAPGDDGTTGAAAQYDVRYSAAAITETNWQAATPVGSVPAPQAAGLTETFTISGLTASTTYHFAVKSSDEATNWSGLSNDAVGATPDSEGTWQCTFGGAFQDEGLSLAPTLGDGCVVAGYSFSFAGSSQDKTAYLVKLSDTGTVVWRLPLPWEYSSEAACVVATNDGGFVAAGYGAACCYLPNGKDGYVSKVNVNGVRAWTARFGDATGDDIVYSVAAAADGGFVVTGSFANGTQLMLLKANSAGQHLWQQVLDSTETGQSAGFSVKPAADGGYIVTGVLNSRMILLKADAYGDRQWLKEYGSLLTTSAGSAVLTLPDGYLIAGRTTAGGSRYDDVFLVRTDLQGNSIWDRTFGDAGYDWASSLVATGAGDFLVIGSTNSSGAGGYDMLLIKVDGGGNLLWQKTYGGSGTEWGNGIVAARHGGYLLVGATASCGGGGSDMYVIKIDENGNL